MGECVFPGDGGKACGEATLARKLCKRHYSEVHHKVGPGRKWGTWDDAARELKLPEIAGPKRVSVRGGKPKKKQKTVKGTPAAGRGRGKVANGGAVTEIEQLAADVRAYVERLHKGVLGRAKRVVGIFKNARKDLIRARELLRTMGLDDEDVNDVLDWGVAKDAGHG